MFESENTTASLYQLLEETCTHLLIFSFTQKNQDTPLTLPKSVYYRMLWSEFIDQTTPCLMLCLLLRHYYCCSFYCIQVSHSKSNWPQG